MVKRLLFVAICALAFIGFSNNTSNVALKLRVVQLSQIQWQVVKDNVDTNGYCHVKEQNVLLVITNGLPEVEHLFPLVQDRLERNPLRLEGKRKKKEPYMYEPVPYVGQGGL